MLHAVLHLTVPAALAWLSTRWRTQLAWWPRYLQLLAGLVVDVDHLLATPVYDPGRCGMGFHPLHTWPAVLLYLLLAGWKPARWFGCGLLLHMLLDTLDCLGMPGGSAQLLHFFGRPAWIQ